MFHTFEQVTKYKINDSLGHYVIVEAELQKEAISRMEGIAGQLPGTLSNWHVKTPATREPDIRGRTVGEFLDNCPTCTWGNDSDSQYGKPWVIHVYYLNGEKETYVSQTKE